MLKQDRMHMLLPQDICGICLNSADGNIYANIPSVCCVLLVLFTVYMKWSFKTITFTSHVFYIVSYIYTPYFFKCFGWGKNSTYILAGCYLVDIISIGEDDVLPLCLKTLGRENKYNHIFRMDLLFFVYL